MEEVKLFAKQGCFRSVCSVHVCTPVIAPFCFSQAITDAILWMEFLSSYIRSTGAHAPWKQSNFNKVSDLHALISP